MLLGTLDDSLLENLLAGKEVKAKKSGKGIMRVEIQNSYQNESEFNDDYSRKSLLKIKDRAYVINLDEFKSIGIHWIDLYVNSDGGSASYSAT